MLLSMRWKHEGGGDRFIYVDFIEHVSDVELRNGTPPMYMHEISDISKQIVGSAALNEINSIDFIAHSQSVHQSGYAMQFISLRIDRNNLITDAVWLEWRTLTEWIPLHVCRWERRVKTSSHLVCSPNICFHFDLICCPIDWTFFSILYSLDVYSETRYIWHNEFVRW